MEKNTIGNEPYIKKATVIGSFFVLIDITLKNSVNKYIHWSIWVLCPIGIYR